jgi:hypothetical protein
MNLIIPLLCALIPSEVACGRSHDRKIPKTREISLLSGGRRDGIADRRMVLYDGRGFDQRSEFGTLVSVSSLKIYETKSCDWVNPISERVPAC